MLIVLKFSGRAAWIIQWSLLEIQYFIQLQWCWLRYCIYTHWYIDFSFLGPYFPCRGCNRWKKGSPPGLDTSSLQGPIWAFGILLKGTLAVLWRWPLKVAHLPTFVHNQDLSQEPSATQSPTDWATAAPSILNPLPNPKSGFQKKRGKKERGRKDQRATICHPVFLKERLVFEWLKSSRFLVWCPQWDV